MRIAIIVYAVIALIFSFAAADSMAQSDAKAPKTTVAPAKAPAQPLAPAQKLPRANFAIVTGSISKIDTTDPNNLKIEVISETDNTTHSIAVTPWTNVTKVTDISELKSGDTVRVMSRKIEDKEVAMGVMFGKIKRMTPPAAQAAVPSPAPAQPKQ